ncbi:single-stranded DNA-binding protein [Rhizobium skierniewicense]|uniref:Single-stranded DNA-binding protein n=1 Tax=Rhizobium skierniewicense TaxID=984260 RepID=A0A7W6CC72_9HYPH|nr:single-stranded DNA-binding protein [Rhizobium skierniewicense]MBB3948399.1 single-stranded DNA-binding protein [Rhizobium skierniewicense]
MKNHAEFDILGRVGRISPFESATRVSICANYRRQEREGGEWIDDPHWNEVVVFNKRTRDFIANHVGPGDLVIARGKLRQSKFTDSATGEERYSTDLIVLDFGQLAKKQPEDN